MHCSRGLCNNFFSAYRSTNASTTSVVMSSTIPPCRNPLPPLTKKLVDGRSRKAAVTCINRKSVFFLSKTSSTSKCVFSVCLQVCMSMDTWLEDLSLCRGRKERMVIRRASAGFILASTLAVTTDHDCASHWIDACQRTKIFCSCEGLIRRVVSVQESFSFAENVVTRS